MSERRAAERGQREAEQRFRRSFEDSGIGKALVGVRGGEANQLIEANEALSRLCGYPREQLIGVRTIAEMVHPDDVPAIAEGMRIRGAVLAADAALYEAKGARRDCIVERTPSKPAPTSTDPGS